jgi:hypothetical protein
MFGRPFRRREWITPCSSGVDESRRRDAMSLRDEPHYQIASSELADWLESQGPDIWWSVDGDPILTGRMSLPAPADELAAELRRINRLLLVLDPSKSPASRGQEITAQELDKLATRPGDEIPMPGPGPRPAWMDDREFYMAWADRGDEWMLVEDRETTEEERREAARLAQGTGA